MIKSNSLKPAKTRRNKAPNKKIEMNDELQILTTSLKVEILSQHHFAYALHSICWTRGMSGLTPSRLPLKPNSSKSEEGEERNV